MHWAQRVNVSTSRRVLEDTFTLHSIDELQRFSTPPYRCLYLPTETASLTYRIIRDLTAQQYNELLRRGWRRFGCEFFRPACAQCVQCRSLRLPLADFRLSRSQKRTLRRNAAIRVVVQRPTLTHEHIQLFNAYHAYMHAQRGWPAQTTHERAYFRSFLLGNWSFAREFLYYDRECLVGVGLADITHEALSSIYFFHDPAWRPHAPGVFSILRQAAYARQQGLRYHYLGYWVADSASMAYKAQYRPHQILRCHPPDEEEPEWAAPE